MILSDSVKGSILGRWKGALNGEFLGSTVLLCCISFIIHENITISLCLNLTKYIISKMVTSCNEANM